MNKMVWLFCFMLLLVAHASTKEGNSPSDEGGRKLTTMTIEQRKQHMMEQVGGLITRPSSEPGVLFLNLQNRVSSDRVRLVVDTIGHSAKVKHHLETNKGKGQNEIMRALARTNEVGMVVAIIDEKDQPSLLMSQDQGWAQVNVAALMTDRPDAAKLDARLTKQLWRATGLVFGGGYSVQFSSSVMRPARTLEALDAITGQTFATDTVQVILKSAELMGIGNDRLYTYKKACEEGWAPMPTNSFQKVIWEEARAKKAVDKK
jgi:hypothetical protein